jgi:hypothetical protein
MIPESACGSKEGDLPLFRFPLRGKTGAGGFPPRRDTCRASQNRWHVPCGGSPHKRAVAPLCIPRCDDTFAAVFADFDRSGFKI